ncbi:MAG: hypothetical protein GY900_08825, partial [Actinomycetia bacterium]|nr:hypothetical protein [Actinomycetes bacterium]
MNGTEIHTHTPNGRFHHLTSTSATAIGRFAVPMRSLVTKILAMTAVFVLAGTTALVPAAQAWSDDDVAVTINFDGNNWGNTKDVDVAADGGFIACGHLRGFTDLDPDPANVVDINPGGNNQPGMVVKYDAAGNYEWRGVVHTPNGSVNSCVLGDDGSAYATGFFRKHAWVVNDTQKVWTDMGSGKDNAFVAKFAPDGTPEWIRAPKRTTGNPGDNAKSHGYGIDVDAAGNVYITGVFMKTVDLNLDAGVEENHKAPGNDWFNTYLIKLDTNGNTEWANSWGGSSNTFGRGVVVDNAGDVVVGGWSSPIEMDIDPDPVDELLVGTPGGDDGNNRSAMISKFDSTGDLIWGHTLGSATTEYFYGITVDADDNIYAVGQAGRTNKAVHDGNWQTNPALPVITVDGLAHGDGLVAKFNPAGDTQWVQVFGGDGKVNLSLDAVVSNGVVYSAGRFSGTVDFTGGTSTTVVPGQVENAGSKHDPYMVGHNTADGSLVCVAVIADAPTEDKGGASGIAVDVAGNVYVAGHFHRTVDFDPGTGETLFTSAGNSDGFVARYSSDCALDDTDIPTPPAPAVPPSFTVETTNGCLDDCLAFHLAEGGNTATFTVVLDTAPSSDVVFDVTSSDTTEATVSPSTLTFTTTDWATPQSVTVSSVDDDLDDARKDWDVTVSIDAGASDDAWDSLADQEIKGKTTDDDASGFDVAFPTAAIDVSEAGSTLDLSVVLHAKPTADVTVSMTGHDATEVQPGPAVTFTPDNWNVAQTVTVTGVDDSVDDGDVTSIASFEASSADSAYDGLTRQVFFITTDDDTAGISLTGTSVTVSEAGTAGSVTVVLDSQPTADVVFTVVGSDASEASVAPTTITFTTTNWNVGQDVTITGVDDVATDGPQASTVTLSPASSDSAYDAMADLVVDVTTTDDDTAGVTVSQSDGSTVVSEAGTTDVVSVVLNTQPTSDVTITVALSGSDEASSDVAELTFTDTNWNTAQTVTVTGIDDDVDDGDEDTTMT